MRRVEIYTKPFHIPSHVTKRDLTRAGIPYTEKPADNYTGFLKQLDTHGHPVVIVYLNGRAHHWWSTYRKDQINALARTWWETNNSGGAA